MTAKQQLQGSFHEIKGQIRNKFGEITDDEFERVGGSVEKLVGMIQQKTGKAREEIQAFIQDAIDAGSDMAQRAADTARDYASQAGRAAREGYEQAADRFREGYGRAEEMVRRNPVESLAVALAAGMITGALLGLMMNRSR